MAKKDYKLVGVAITIGVLAVGALIYMNSSQEPEVPLTNSPVTALPKSQETETAAIVNEGSVATPLPEAKTPETPPEAEYVDPVVKEQKDKLQNFKNLLRLEVDLPPGMHYTELDLENDVAALEATSQSRKILIMGAKRTASPELIATYLREQKSSIPMLTTHDFKISGAIQNVPPPKNSGISKITVIPGGTHEGNAVFAAYLERADKKGSYVFIMEASPGQFSQYDGLFDQMLESLKANP